MRHTVGQAITQHQWWRVALVVGLWSASAHAAPVIESKDRLELNWSTMRIRFYGEAMAEAKDSFKAAEKKAWYNGLSYVSEAVRNLNVSAFEDKVTDIDRLSDDAKEAARKVSTSTFSYNTTYFTDGMVRVHLENLLPKVYGSSVIRFRQKESFQPSMMQYTGVVFETNKAVRPLAVYQVVDQTGGVLFDVTDMAEDAFRQNLMGRWFKRPREAELADAVGKNPLKIRVEATALGQFEASREEWDAAISGHRSLLVNGRIAIALP